MAFIEVVPPRRARGPLADVYRYCREVVGVPLIGNVVRIFSLRPESMRRAIRFWELSMWSGREARTTRELVAVAVSRLEDCHY